MEIISDGFKSYSDLITIVLLVLSSYSVQFSNQMIGLFTDIFFSDKYIHYELKYSLKNCILLCRNKFLREMLISVLTANTYWIWIINQLIFQWINQSINIYIYIYIKKNDGSTSGAMDIEGGYGHGNLGSPISKLLTLNACMKIFYYG